MMNEPAPITWRGRLIAVLIGLVFLAVVSEVLLRILMPNWREYHAGRFMTSVPVPGYGMTSMGVPGFDGRFAQNNGDFRVRIRVNEFGLRNDEPVAAANGRIWVIGDSMSFGWGVEREESYTQVLADRLGFPTYNIATPGSSVCGWQALYARMPKELRPAAVVVGLTIENRVGIFDCAAQARSTEIHEPLTISRIAVKGSMTRNLALYNFLTVSLKRVDVIAAALTRIGVINEPHGILLHGQDPTKIPEMTSSTANELFRLRAMVPADRPFLVVLFPARFEIRDDTEHFRRTRLGMAEALARGGIETLDLFPEFKAAGLEATHFTHDGHWNARGHRIAGEALARWFAARPAADEKRP